MLLVGLQRNIAKDITVSLNLDRWLGLLRNSGRRRLHRLCLSFILGSLDLLQFDFRAIERLHINIDILHDNLM